MGVLTKHDGEKWIVPTPNIPGPAGEQGPPGADGEDGEGGGGGDDGEHRREIVVPTDSTEGTGFAYAIETIDVQYEVDSETSPDLLSVQVDGQVRSWMNEWGALRGTSPYGWGDALVRAVVDTGDVITEGNAFEIVDRNLPAGVGRQRWGRAWATGTLVRNGLNMADVIVLAESDDIPDDLPSGCVIIRVED